jgi:hypothetical protein
MIDVFLVQDFARRIGTGVDTISQPANRMADVAAVQANIRKRVFISLSAMVVVSAIAYQLIPVDRFIDALKTPADRLIFTIQCNVLPVMLLFVMCAHIGNTRYASHQSNPLLSEDRDKIEVVTFSLKNST